MSEKNGKAVVSILVMVCLGHLFNDMFQAVIPAIYPMLKEAMGLSFLQIGICFTLLGLLLLSAADSVVLVLAAVALVGVGSSVLHPESSKVARLASGGAKGMAQSVFQVGGNIGRAFSPVVVALIIVPHGQGAIRWLCLMAVAAVILLAVIGRWYRGQIALYGYGRSSQSIENKNRLPRGQIITALLVLLVLMFSKDFYITNIHSYLTFYLISKFGISIAASQYCLFAFLVASAAGLIAGGTLGDRWGRKYVIWVSILGAAPFALLLPYCGLVVTVVLAMLVGMIMSSAMSAILVYATELLPGNIGMVSGAFFGLSFGLGGIGSALFGWLADVSGIQYVFQLTAFLPLLGAVTYFLPDIKD